MIEEIRAGNWRMFFVLLSGRTNGAHLPWVSKFKAIGQIEVDSPEDSDYILLFCPVTSRVGTDISEALEKIPVKDKGFILVVMHHTFNRDYVVAESWRQVNNPNLNLVVDTVFFEGRLLESNLNDIAWDKIRRFLGLCAELSAWNPLSIISTIYKWVPNWKWLFLALCAGGLLYSMRNHWTPSIEPEEVVGKNK